MAGVAFRAKRDRHKIPNLAPRRAALQYVVGVGGAGSATQAARKLFYAAHDVAFAFKLAFLSLLAIITARLR